MKEMANLYELSAEFSAVERELDELDEDEMMINGSLEDLLISKLEVIQGEADMMAANAIAWFKSVKAEIVARKEEIDKLRARNKAAENKMLAIKTYLGRWLEASKSDKFKCSIGSAYYMKGKESTEVDTAQVENWPADVYDAALDSGALRIEYQVLSTKLKELFPDNSWQALPGVEVKTGEKSLVIK